MTGCAIGGAADEPTVDPRVTVLPAISGMVVTPDAVALPRAGNEALASLAAGDIVISAEREGFLRGVDSVALGADTITLATHDAELSDALIDASIASSLGGAGKADTYQLPAIHLSLANRRVVDNTALTAVVSGSLGLEPQLDLDLQIADRRLQQFAMVLSGRVTGSLDIQLDAREANVGPELTLWESPPAIFYQQVGPVPVVETVTTSVTLQLQVVARGEGRLHVTADTIATLAGGVRYDRATGWQGVGDLDLDASGSVPETSVTLTDLGVRAWLTARADVRLYGIAGPYVQAGPQLEVVRDLVHGDFDASVGFRGYAGGALKIARLNVPALPGFDLFDVEKPVL